MAVRLPPARLLLAAFVAVDAAIGLGFAHHRAASIAVALLPALLLVVLALAFEPGIVLLLALVLGFTYPAPLLDPLPFAGGNLYAADVVLALALAAGLGRLLLFGGRGRPLRPATPVLGPAFAVFAALVIAATVRGHELYGQSLVGAPTRLFAYAGIGAAMLWLRPGWTYRALATVFYAGAVWETGVGAYLLAAGGSQTTTAEISTGGYRILAGSTAMLLSGSLLLALLNVRREQFARRQALHLAVAAVSVAGLVLTFQRTTFAAVAVLVPALFVLLRGLTSRVLTYLPLCVPFLVVAALVVPRTVPHVVSMFEHRLTASPTTDASVIWRQKATSAVFEQARESPLTGVGFGRDAIFRFDRQRQNVHQDPHNQYVYLWAGGGLLLLGSWVVLMAGYLWDVRRRLRAARGDARVVTIWSLAMWFVLSVNAATGVVLVDQGLLLLFWVVLLLPAVVVPRRPAGEPEPAALTLAAAPYRA